MYDDHDISDLDDAFGGSGGGYAGTGGYAGGGFGTTGGLGGIMGGASTSGMAAASAAMNPAQPAAQASTGIPAGPATGPAGPVTGGGIASTLGRTSAPVTSNPLNQPSAFARSSYGPGRTPSSAISGMLAGTGTGIGGVMGAAPTSDMATASQAYSDYGRAYPPTAGGWGGGFQPGANVRPLSSLASPQEMQSRLDPTPAAGGIGRWGAGMVNVNPTNPLLNPQFNMPVGYQPPVQNPLVTPRSDPLAPGAGATGQTAFQTSPDRPYLGVGAGLSGPMPPTNPLGVNRAALANQAPIASPSTTARTDPLAPYQGPSVTATSDPWGVNRTAMTDSLAGPPRPDVAAALNRMRDPYGGTLRTPMGPFQPQSQQVARAAMGDRYSTGMNPQQMAQTSANLGATAPSPGSLVSPQDPVGFDPRDPTGRLAELGQSILQQAQTNRIAEIPGGPLQPSSGSQGPASNVAAKSDRLQQQTAGYPGRGTAIPSAPPLTRPIDLTETAQMFNRPSMTGQGGIFEQPSMPVTETPPARPTLTPPTQVTVRDIPEPVPQRPPGQTGYPPVSNQVGIGQQFGINPTIQPAGFQSRGPIGGLGPLLALMAGGGIGAGMVGAGASRRKRGGKKKSTRRPQPKGLLN